MDTFDKFVKLQKEANDFGFSWPNYAMIIKQLISECSELQSAIQANENNERQQEEMGDLLLAAFSLCTFLGFEPKTIVEKATGKFEKRFEILKKLANERGFKNLKNQPIEILMDFWKQAKTSALIT